MKIEDVIGPIKPKLRVDGPDHMWSVPGKVKQSQRCLCVIGDAWLNLLIFKT